MFKFSTETTLCRTGYSTVCSYDQTSSEKTWMAFTKECLDCRETFKSVIFTDESTIWLERHEPPKMKPKAPHPFKVNVWAGISKRGTTPVLIFTGIMWKEFYIEQILRNVLLPFTQTTFADGYRFQQDNDPKHKSEYL